MYLYYISMANNQITMTQREKWALEAKAKQGWKCYFIERDRFFEVFEGLGEQRTIAQRLRAGEQIDITHLTNMFLELYDKVGELVNCPVCLEVMTKEKTHIPLCGHLICKDCKATPILDKCPICRKIY